MDDGHAAAWSAVAASRLRHLVVTVHPRRRGPYTDQEIADGTNTKAGAALVTAEQVEALREGRTASAQTPQIDAVAAFIGVAPRYFQDDELAARVDEQLEQLAALAELRARGVVSIRARRARDALAHAGESPPRLDTDWSSSSGLPLARSPER